MNYSDSYKKILAVFITAAVCIGFFVVLTFWYMNQEIKENRKVELALHNLYFLENLLADVQSLQTGQRGFIISGDTTFLNTYHSGMVNLKDARQKIESLKLEDPVKLKERKELFSLVDAKVANLENIKRINQHYGRDSASALVRLGVGEKLMAKIRSQVNLMEDKDRLILREANARSDEMANRAKWQFSVVAFIFFTALVSNFITIRRDHRKRVAQDKKLNYSASLSQSITDPIISVDEKGKVISWNKYAESLYGWKENEVIGKLIDDVLQPGYVSDSREEIIGQLKEKGEWKGEMIQYDRNGKPLKIQASLSVIRDETGRGSGTVGIMTDITKRKEVEKRLQDITSDLEEQVKIKAAELHNVFERITDAFIALDRNWCYTYLNEKAVEMHGKKSASELIGKNIWEEFPHEKGGSFYDALHEAMRTMKPLKVQLYAASSGQWFEDLIYPSANGLSIYYHDITQRKRAELQLIEAEEKFRNLVEASMVGVYIIQDGKLDYVNPCFLDIFGFKEGELNRDFNVMNMVVEEDREIVEENIRKRIHNEEKSLNYEFRAHKKSGEIINVEVYGTKIIYKGRPAIIGMLVDTTERKRSMLELEASEKKLQVSNERFMLVAKATNDAVWDWDLVTDMIWGNEAFHNIVQAGNNEKVKHDDFMMRVHPDDTSSMMKNLSETMKNRRNFMNEEFRFRMADGTFRTLYNRYSILYDDGGKAYRVLGAMQDVTAQRMVQKQLLLEKQLSDSIINSLPGVFYLFNQSGQFLRWNNNFEKVTGYTAREISGLHPIDLFSGDDKDLLKEKIANVFKTGEDHVEAGFMAKDGTITPYYFTGMLITYEGETCLVGVGIDISEQVKSQRQLVKSEENFRNLIEQASDGIFISDSEGAYKVVNKSACILTGYSREELLTKHITDLIHEENSSHKPLSLTELTSGDILISEWLMKRKDGSSINVEISAKQLQDGRYQGIVRDITARKKSEEILRDSEEKRRLIMNAALDAIITTSPDGYVTFWNPHAEKIFGWKAEEVFGKSLPEVIIPHRLRNGNGNGNGNHSMKNLGNREALNQLVEVTAVKRSGEEFPVELTVLSIKQLHDSFYCVFIRDITERKKAEEEIRISEHKYRLLFEQNPLPMWMMSLPDKKFLDVNEAAVEFYGFSKEEFLSMKLKDIRPEQNDETTDIISTYKSGINNTGIWQHRKKDGSLVKMNLMTHDVIYQGKHAKLVLANDVTDKIEAEEKLKTSYIELRELATHLQSVREAERTHMAREIHDELGQQLTGLKMDISWIGRKLGNVDDEIKTKMDETLSLIDTTVKTVRRIATQLRPSILDDLGIVAALEWQSEEFQKRSQIECSFTSNVPSIVVPSEIATGFFRIYQESLTNVLRHSKATKVETTLVYKDNLMILNITDNGVGFNASEIENKKTLGLLGMKERTLMMGGSYEITSKPGLGTKVIILVPIHN